jgi:hypothetical protein
VLTSFSTRRDMSNKSITKSLYDVQNRFGISFPIFSVPFSFSFPFLFPSFSFSFPPFPISFFYYELHYHEKIAFRGTVYLRGTAPGSSGSVVDGRWNLGHNLWVIRFT